MPTPLQLGAAERVCGPRPDLGANVMAEPRMLDARSADFPAAAIHPQEVDHRLPPPADTAAESAAVRVPLAPPAAHPFHVSAAQSIDVPEAVVSRDGEASRDWKSEDSAARRSGNPSDLMSPAALSGWYTAIAEANDTGEPLPHAGAASFPMAAETATDIDRISKNHNIDGIEQAMINNTCTSAASAELKPSRGGDAVVSPSTPRISDDSTATIFREMIRDVIRHELQSDRANGLSEDLRAMILHEVALALAGRRMAQ